MWHGAYTLSRDCIEKDKVFWQNNLVQSLMHLVDRHVVLNVSGIVSDTWF